MTTASVPAQGPSPEPASEAPPSAPPAVRHPLTLPHFRNLWIGTTISLLGDQFYFVALPWLVLQLTGSGLSLGAIVMTGAIPRATLMLVGGAVTDRVSHRLVLITTAVSRAILVGAMAALVWLDVVKIWQLYLLSLSFGIANAFSVPASGALIPSLVKPQQLQRANSLLQSSMVLTQMTGAAAAGLAIKSWGVAPALLIDALSFLAVIAALFNLPDPAQPAAGAVRPNMMRSIAEGLRSVRQDQPLLALMVVFAMINFCAAGPIGIGLATVAKFNFKSAAAFGTLLSCFSGGTLAGILLAGTLKKHRRRGLLVLAVGVLAGLELAGMGLILKLVPIAILLALMGFGIGFVNVQFRSWIQMRVDRALMGRVISVMSVSSIGLVPVSYAASGFLAQWSIRGLFIVAGAALVIVTCAMALFSKSAREID